MGRIKNGIMLKLIITLALVVLVGGKRKSYSGYKVYVVTPETNEQMKLLEEMFSGTEYSFWIDPVGINIPVQILVAPGQIPDFEKSMKETGTRHKVSIEDVQRLHDKERVQRRRTRSSGLNFHWDQYHKLDDINRYLEKMIEKYPKQVVRRTLERRSYEGREIKGVKLSFNKENPRIFIEGGIHGREWISPATVTYILHELLTSDDPRIKKLAQNYNWYFFPVVNPDGYHYSHKKDRMWRKSRKPYKMPGEICYGTDLNRNWGYKWSRSSIDPCNDAYPGKEAFSDRETIALSNYIKTISEKLYAYISFHSFGQFLLTPYGCTTKHSDNHEELHAIGKKAIAALKKRYGTNYTIGTAAKEMGIRHGISLDWVKGTLEIPLTYTYELRDEYQYGFLLPPDQIIPTGKETIDSLVALFEEAENRGTLKRWQDAKESLKPPTTPRRWLNFWIPSSNPVESSKPQKPSNNRWPWQKPRKPSNNHEIRRKSR